MSGRTVIKAERQSRHALASNTGEDPIRSREILSGHVPSGLLMIGAGLEALMLAGVFLWLAARLFSCDKIIFGR